MRKNVPLKSIYSFVAVAETGSMQAAAVRLHVSHSAISQSIKALESQLDTELFVRIGRHIELNSYGQEYYQAVAPALQKIIQASETLLTRNNHYRLTVNMVNSLALHWWIPRVSHLKEFAPQLDICMSNRVGAFDLDKEGVDVAIVHDCIDHWQNYYCEKLADDELVLVCSPNLLRERANLSVEEIIARFPTISVSTESRKNDWSLWCDAYALALPDNPNNVVFNVSIQAIHAAIRSLGVLVTHRQFVKDDVEHGLLVEIGNSVSNPVQGYYFVCSPEKLKFDRVLSLREWLREAFTSPNPINSR